MHEDLLGLRPDDPINLQYTSGTTRELPEAVKHTHRSIVTLMVAALYGTGLRHVWAVQYINSMGAVILDTLEVGSVPVAVLAAPEDFEDSAERLAEILQAFTS